MTIELVILVNDECVAQLKKDRVSGKNYNKVVMSLMKNAHFTIKDGRGIDPDIFPDLDLNRAFADISVNKAFEDAKESI